MKFKLFLAMIIAIALLAACGADGVGPGAEEDAPEEENGTDVATSASQALDEDELREAAGENGTWIVIPMGDMHLDTDLVVAGEFHNQGDEDNDVYRKIAAYTQDEDRNIIDQWTITVPRLVIQSENTNFQGGFVDGDIYVEADGFLLHESATVMGDLIFANEDVEASATVDGEVQGETVVE